MSESGPSVPVSVLNSIFITGRTTFVVVVHMRIVLNGDRGFLGDRRRGVLTGEAALVVLVEESFVDVSLLDVSPMGSIISTSLSETPGDLDMGLKNVEMSWLGLLLAGGTLPGKDLVFLGSPPGCFLDKELAVGVESQPPALATQTTSLSLSLFV